MQTKSLNDIDNIRAALEEASLKAGVNVENLTCKIRAFRTYMKQKGAEFFEVVKDAKMLDNDEIFESDAYEFRQVYDIDILPLRSPLGVEVRVNGDFESVDLMLEKSFVAPQNDDEFTHLIATINALKAAQGVILRNLNAEKEKIRAFLGRFAKNDERILRLCEAKHFKSAVKAHLEFHIKGIDLSKNNIICARENTHICDFCAAKDAISGRNLAGLYITHEESKEAQNPPILSDDFSGIDEGDKQKIICKKAGFVIFSNNQFSLSAELALSNVKARDNYHFIGDMSAETSLVIGTSGEFDDALNNASVMAKKITINGNIGANVHITAESLALNGRTHKDSSISANEATITTHRGSLSAKNVVITTLESGNVDCENLRCDKANGGILYANIININELHSNSLIYFSHKCEVANMLGGGNKITFTPLGSPSAKAQITDLMQKLESATHKHKEITSKADVLIYEYRKYQSTAKELKDTIAKAKLQDKNPPAYVVENYNVFLEIVKSLKRLKKENLEVEKEKASISNALKDAQQAVFDAEFICKDGWNKYNDVIFEMVMPKIHSLKTIIKGAGRYSFDKAQKKLSFQKIFGESETSIDNQGF